MTPSDVDYQRAVDLLLADELVAIPTETVYGLGADAANQQMVTVHQQVLRRYGCGHPIRGRQHKLGRLSRRDMLHHHLEAWITADHGD